MHTDMALTILRDHQAAILTQIDGALRLRDRTPEAAIYPLSMARWRVARMLRAYQIFKHVEIFDPAMASGSPVQRAGASEMKVRCIAMGGRFDAYLRRWSSADLVGCWPDYTAAMTELCSALRAHINAEHEDVTALLSSATRTRHLSKTRIN